MELMSAKLTGKSEDPTDAEGGKRMTKREWIHRGAIPYEGDECKVWPFKVNRHGKGHIKPRNTDDKMDVQRYIMMCMGNKMDGLTVRTTCPNKACCNPKHIYLVTFLG